jgi:septal ring factor EnvC (AmiA/AmiB activator)
MTNIANIQSLRLERLSRDATANRISPLETLNRSIELFTITQEGHIGQIEELHQSYKECVQDLKQVAQAVVESVNLLKEKNTEVKDLYKFLEKIGMKQEYENRLYKRQMAAIYRRSRKERAL